MNTTMKRNIGTNPLLDKLGGGGRQPPTSLVGGATPDEPGPPGVPSSDCDSQILDMIAEGCPNLNPY
jgi:hypothetical protein